jgi:hypothetical protein
MEKSLNVLKGFSSLAVASLALIYIPFIAASVDATEENSKLKSGFVSTQNNSAKIEMTSEDADYLETIRDHYNLY